MTEGIIIPNFIKFHKSFYNMQKLLKKYIIKNSFPDHFVHAPV